MSEKEQSNTANNKKVSCIKNILIDRPACIGAGSCAVLASKTFALDDEAKAIVLDMHGDTDEDIIEAAKSCPTDAITIEDIEGKQRWPLPKEE